MNSHMEAAMKSIERLNKIESSNSIEDEIISLAPWFHNLHLPDGTETAPDHFLGDFPSYKWELIGEHIPNDLTGWRILDIGCNAGYYSFELARRGGSVLGIDVDPHYLKQARWAVKQFQLEDRVEFRQMQVYDLSKMSERFDLVMFMGVFYHLRYPMLALDLVAQKVGRLLVFQALTMPGEEILEDTYDRGWQDRDAMLDPGWPKMAFIEHRFTGDPTNWWVPNRSGVESMLRSSGMKIIERPECEIYVCELDPDHPSCVSTWNCSELLSATGQKWPKNESE